MERENGKQESANRGEREVNEANDKKARGKGLWYLGLLHIIQ